MDARWPGRELPALLAGATTSGLDFNGLDGLLGYRLRRAHGAAHRDYLATLGKARLTQKQAAVLWLVEANPGVAQGAIGAVLGMDRATMMVLVNRMEARGLIRRSRSRTDGRCRELHVTPVGLRLLARVRERVETHEQRMRKLFTAQEAETLHRLLARLQALDRARPY
jgi:DNA-binding MarR family transcriptional regulator